MDKSLVLTFLHHEDNSLKTLEWRWPAAVWGHQLENVAIDLPKIQHWVDINLSAHCGDGPPVQVVGTSTFSHATLWGKQYVNTDTLQWHLKMSYTGRKVTKKYNFEGIKMYERSTLCGDRFPVQLQSGFKKAAFCGEWFPVEGTRPESDSGGTRI